MLPKRESGGAGEVELEEEFADPEDSMEDASAEFAKPVYLVAVREDERAAYCVIEIDAAAAAGGNERHRARTVAGLPGTERGMSFVAAHSKHGSWIVGVGGGLRAGTIIFDPVTLETYQGPRLSKPKDRPILISHGGEVYAISRRPRLVPYFDTEPWFQSLSFNNGIPSKELGVLASWRSLPPPPFFPSLVDPFEFRNPPQISVTSYAAVGSHILISAEQVHPQHQELNTGTYAFHLGNKTWEKAHNNNLPFVGQAVPLGGNLFAAYPVSSNGTDSVFHISIKVSPSTPMAAMSTPFVSIQEFPVAAVGDKIPWPLFCPLGKDSFCSIRLGSICRSRRKANSLKEIQVILTAFQLERQSIEAIMTACQSHGAEVKDLMDVVQVKEQSHTYKSKGRSQRLMDSDMPVVAAVSMDRDSLELFDGGRTETRASPDGGNTIFVAPVIRYRTLCYSPRLSILAVL